MHTKLRNDQLGRISAQEYKLSKKMPVTIVLDNVRSMHNIGSAFRSADSFLVEQILLCGICACPPSAEIHKSALGAEFSVEWSYNSSTIEAVTKLKEQGYIILSVEQAINSISLESLDNSLKELKNDTPLRGYALVFGNEVKGVQQEVINISNGVIEIPQFGTKHSLNISVSLGIVLWEFAKLLLCTNINK